MLPINGLTIVQLNPKLVLPIATTSLKIFALEVVFILINIHAEIQLYSVVHYSL